MATNVSLERFRALTNDLKAQVFKDAATELAAQADKLAALIKQVVPRGETGELEHSVRVIPGKTDLVKRVVAGGRLTIRESVSSKPYDYARGDEFGTRDMKAQPFFFPTYRLSRKRIKSAMKRKLTATIKRYSAEK